MQRKHILSQKDSLWKKLFRVFAFLSLISSPTSSSRVSVRGDYSVYSLSDDLIVNHERGRDIYRPHGQESTLVCFERFRTESEKGRAAAFRVYDHTGKDAVAENIEILARTTGCDTEKKSDRELLTCVLKEGLDTVVYDRRTGSFDTLVQLVDFDECLQEKFRP